MGVYHGPKVRRSRRVGAPIAETPKHTAKRNPSRPGVHGTGRRGRSTLYGTQLTEKQKLCFYYNIRDKQMRRYMANASRQPDTGRALVTILERRLDNVIRRLGWGRTIWQIRQLVSHGHFRVNGRKVDIPSFPVEPGDVITMRERSRDRIKEIAATREELALPDWLALDEATMTGRVLRLPALEDLRLPLEVDLAAVVEFYTR